MPMQLCRDATCVTVTLFSVLARDRVESAYLTYECVRVCGWCLKTPVFGLWIRSMCWGPRGVTQVRPTSRSTCVTDSRSNLISGPLSSPMVHVVWPLTYTHGPNTHTTHTRGHSDLSRPIWPHTDHRTGCPEKNREKLPATCATGLQPGRPGSRAMT